MQILSGFLYIFFGVLLIYLGSFQIILNMLPKEYGLKTAEIHGTWVRKNVLKLPDLKE